MVPTPDQPTEEPQQPDEATRNSVPTSAGAQSNSNSQPSSPSKVDRTGDIDNLESSAPKSPEVVRELVKPESIAAAATSDDDRSPGKTDRTGAVPEATDVKPAEKVRKPIMPDDLSKS